MRRQVQNAPSIHPREHTRAAAGHLSLVSHTPANHDGAGVCVLLVVTAVMEALSRLPCAQGDTLAACNPNTWRSVLAAAVRAYQGIPAEVWWAALVVSGVGRFVTLTPEGLYVVACAWAVQPAREVLGGVHILSPALRAAWARANPGAERRASEVRVPPAVQRAARATLRALAHVEVAPGVSVSGAILGTIEGPTAPPELAGPVTIGPELRPRALPRGAA